MTQQVALITGANRGIGLAVAQALAAKGFAVAINGLKDDDSLAAAVASITDQGRRAIKVPGDVTNLERHDAMLARVEDALGPLTTLVNNAGVPALARGDLLEVSEASYDRCMNVNAKAPFFLSQAFAKRLAGRKREEGLFYSLINLTSSSARAVSVSRLEYCVSKAAAAMMTQGFAVRLGQEGIAVYDIQPGVIATDMTAPVIEEYQRRIDDEGLTVLPRVGTPQDMGAIAAMLASGGMPYTTGQVISADAGLLISRY